VAADLDAERLSRQSFEWRRMARGGPQFQLRVAGGAQLQQVVVAAVVELEPGDGLGVAAVETFRQPQDRRQRAHRPAGAPPERDEAVVPSLRRGLPVITGDQRDGFDFVGLEAAEIAVLDEIVRVFVVAFVADVHADVVQDRGIFKPLSLAIGQAVNGAGLIEQADRQARDMLRVLRPVVAALGQLEHAAAADVGVAVRLGDFLAMS
jgi:hypothetical protein